DIRIWPAIRIAAVPRLDMVRRHMAIVLLNLSMGLRSAIPGISSDDFWVRFILKQGLDDFSTWLLLHPTRPEFRLSPNLAYFITFSINDASSIRNMRKS